MIGLFIVLSLIIAVCVFASLRIDRKALRYGLSVAVIFLGMYGTYRGTRHFYLFRFYSGYIAQNLAYADFLRARAGAGDFETVSNAVVFFETSIAKDPESLTNMIYTVNSILQGDYFNPTKGRGK